MLDHGVDTKIHYPIPLHKQECYVTEFGSDISLPFVEKFSDEMISLPIYPFLTESEISHVIMSVNTIARILQISAGSVLEFVIYFQTNSLHLLQLINYRFLQLIIS